MKTLLTLPFISLLFVLQLSAQSTPFELVYGAENSQEVGTAALQMPDGHVYMLGNIQSDTTTGQDVLLVKVSPAGEVVWAKSYDNGQSEFAYDFIQKDGKFIIAGESNVVNGLDKNAFVLKVDADGNSLGFNLLGEPTKAEQFQSIAATELGYIACGFITSETGVGNDIFVYHFGDLLFDSWDKAIGVPVNDIGMAVEQLPDGNYVVCGDRRVDSVTYNAFVMVLNNRGDILHETIIQSPFNGGSKNLTITDDGHILVVGEMATSTSPAFDIFWTKLTPQAEVLWTTYVPSTDASDAGFDLCQVNTGSFVITGYSFNEAAANTDIVAISVDSLGTEVERKYFGGPGLDIAYDVKPALSGGLLITGKTAKPTHNDAILIHDFLVLATGVKGVIPAVEELSIYPNPMSQAAVLHLPETWHGGTWQLVDDGGELIAQGVVNQSLAVDGLPSGVYFLSVKKAGKTGVGRLVIL